MKTACLTILAFTCTFTARADFSYTQTRKSSAMGPAAALGNTTSKHFLKGQRMKTDNGAMATIVDFEAQTLTIINNDQKSYTVTKFGDVGQSMANAGADVKIDVKETGQRKTINGFNASQVIMTMGIQSMQAGAQGMSMTMEVEMWLSSDVPGAQESRAFFQKNADRFPWTAMAAGANPQLQKSMAEMQKKIASMGGVPVLQITRMKMGGGGPSDAQVAQANAGRAQAMARLEEMKKQGGAQAAAAEQAMARMGAVRGAAGGGGSMFEMTSESTNFSAASIPDSVFAIPAGYQKK